MDSLESTVKVLHGFSLSIGLDGVSLLAEPFILHEAEFRLDLSPCCTEGFLLGGGCQIIEECWVDSMVFLRYGSDVNVVVIKPVLVFAGGGSYNL